MISVSNAWKKREKETQFVQNTHYTMTPVLMISVSAFVLLFSVIMYFFAELFLIMYHLRKP